MSNTLRNFYKRLTQAVKDIIDHDFDFVTAKRAEVEMPNNVVDVLDDLQRFADTLCEYDDPVLEEKRILFTGSLYATESHVDWDDIINHMRVRYAEVVVE